MSEMIQAELKHIGNVDIEDLALYKPDNPESFGFPLHLDVGTKGKPDTGSTTFSLVVCTPKWLYEKYTEDEIVIGRHYLFVFKYDYDKLSERLRTYINNCRGTSWTEVSQKVGRIARSEFEDYDK